MPLPAVRPTPADTVPLVALSGLHDTAPTVERALADRLVEAGRTWGFLYVTHHGVDQARIDRLFALGRQFFALPPAQRDALSMVHGESYRGYLPFDMMGGDTRIKGNLHEGFQIFGEPDELTLLAQDATGGLEVLSQEGVWTGVPPIRGSFVVNIGEMLKIWTDGVLASTPHRVINRHGVDRYSMPFFAIPDFDARIAPMMHNPDAVEEPRFETTVERGKVLTSGEILLQVYRRIWPSASLKRTAD